jgi:hypothetical protein
MARRRPSRVRRQHVGPLNPVLKMRIPFVAEHPGVCACAIADLDEPCDPADPICAGWEVIVERGELSHGLAPTVARALDTIAGWLEDPPPRRPGHLSRGYVPYGRMLNPDARPVLGIATPNKQGEQPPC